MLPPSIRQCANRSTSTEFMALVLPGAVADLDELDSLEDLKFEGTDICIRTGTVITPPLFSAFGGRRWLEEFSAPPRPKQHVKKHRSTFLDGVLTAIRALTDSNTSSVIGFGEGGLIAGGVVSPEIRALAYKERRVGDSESASLESFCTSILQHVLIVAPASNPHKSYMTLLRECVPELSSVTIPCLSCRLPATL